MTFSIKSKHLLKAALGAGVLLSSFNVNPAFSQAAFNLASQPSARTPVSAALKPFSADTRDLFFSGESNFREFTFYALPEETAGENKLILTLQSAISNTPDQSRMAVYVNDVEIGTVPLAGEKRTIALPVNPGLIQPGFNSVTLLVDQFHRVDCSVAATYELWTQIDPQMSGFSFSSRPKSMGGIADLASIAGTDNGKTQITALYPAGSSMKTADMLVETINAMSIAAHFDHPDVSFNTVPGKGPGIDVAIGTPQMVRSLFGDDPALSAAGPGIYVTGSEEGERMRLVIAGRSTEEIGAHIAAFRAQLSQGRDVGTPQGLRALRKLEGLELQPSSNVSFSDLGIDLRSFTGRYFQQSVNFRMPNDFYPGDYGKAQVRLNALYAAGLSKGAELLIKLNDFTVSRISLGASRNGLISEQQLPIPFSAFRPGENTFSIEARLPAPVDDNCDPTRVGGGAGRLRIMGDSYLGLPDFARIGRYPDLAAVNSQFSQFVSRPDAAPLAVLVPRSDLSAMSAAASFFAKLAYASKSVFPTRFVTDIPQDADAALAAFGSYDTLPFDFLRQMNVDFSLSQTVASVSSPLSVEPLAPFASDDISLGLNTTYSPLASGTREIAVLEKAKGVASDYYGRFVASGAEYFEMGRNTTYKVINKLRGNVELLTSPVKQEPVFSPSPDAVMVIAQRKNPSGEAAWTLFASKRGEELHDSLLTMTHRSVWSRLGGTVQSITENGEFVDKVETTDASFFMTQPPEVSNLRLIVAAWLSTNTDKYVFAVMGTFGFLGVFTHLTLRQARRRRR
ncbi:cellulose biosynthesis cyclic di-GMP-binding regulatory protein BcsB [Hoeflea ulvae]|uniref:Cyclic di-GMP-binding protein n=1 Tax=Hoeflea ulvae TaxID=2983764 RepID=A0ABT3YG79_9HYPH|nr:cellulose biosynthesis cyclic di-GMP-binding regulatory protein BcsB [Hoeflea ulvae]MCY0094909.1 cellulose biosynthesis cyclic di-GMP-binding regulatory protein BcsB [Hoeflea ulvae]